MGVLGVEQFLGCAAENGVIENAGQLSGNRDQKIHFFRMTQARGAILNRQHPQHPAILNQRHAQKSVITVFTDFAHRIKTRMAGGVGHIHRFLALGDQTNQTLFPVEPHPPHRLRIQSRRRHQHMRLIVFVGQINGAGRYVHCGANPVDRNRQRARQIRRGADILYDTAQGFEHAMAIL